jgi:hypothetical protein
MAFNFDLGGACEKIRRAAEDMSGENPAFLMGKQVGALDMITSPDNGGVESELVSWDRKKKLAKLKILYKQRTKTCEILTGDDALNANLCDAGSTPVVLEEIIEVDERLATPKKDFSNDEMVIICEDTESFIRSFLESDLRAAREMFSQVILSKLDDMVGINKHWNGDETAAGAYANKKLLAIDDDGQDVPLPGNYADLLMDFENMEFTGIPAVIGQGYFDKYMKLNNMSCCNSKTPYSDAIEAAELAYFKDQQANSVLGANRVLMLPFGLVHLVTFNKNNNIQINTETHKHITIPDPAGYPFDWDLDFRWDECEEQWEFMYSVYFKLFNVFTANSFKGNSPAVSPACVDSNYGVNGIWGYNITRS